METIPNLKFDGKWGIYGFKDKIGKVDKNFLGEFIPKENTIIIHKQCFDSYNRGNRRELITTIIHELIHANGEKDEKNTLKLESEYYEKYHKIIEEKIEML